MQYKHVQLCQNVELSTQWCKTAHSLYNNFEELSHNKDLPQCTQLWRVVENFMQDDVSLVLILYYFGISFVYIITCVRLQIYCTSTNIESLQDSSRTLETFKSAPTVHQLAKLRLTLAST